MTSFSIVLNLFLFRISVNEALTHPYVAEHHMPTDEPTASQPFDIEENGVERTIDEWKRK